MQVYDDYAICPDKFEEMAKEFVANQSKISGLCAKISDLQVVKKSEISKDDVDMLFKKIEYLRVLLADLKNRSTNSDVLLVLDSIAEEIKQQTESLSKLLNVGISALEQNEVRGDMFCNNLKLSINTAGDIVKLLIKIKDDDQTFELSPALTEAINIFLQINNQLVSLFGECRYLRY